MILICIHELQSRTYCRGVYYHLNTLSSEALFQSSISVNACSGFYTEVDNVCSSVKVTFGSVFKF